LFQLLLFLFTIPVGLIYAFQYIQLLEEELKDVEGDLQEFKDIKDDLSIEGVLGELAMEMGEYDEDEY
jgi:hypothetical protein